MCTAKKMGKRNNISMQAPIQKCEQYVVNYDEAGIAERLLKQLRIYDKRLFENQSVLPVLVPDKFFEEEIPMHLHLKRWVKQLSFPYIRSLNPLNPFIVNRETILKDVDGTVLLHYKPQFFSQDHVELLNKCIQLIQDKYTFVLQTKRLENTNSRSGGIAVGHTACCQKNGNLTMTVAHKHNVVNEALLKLKPVIEEMNTLTSKLFPNFTKKLQQLSTYNKFPLYLFPSGFLNINSAVAPHVDNKDYKSGVSCMAVFGTFKHGGHLVLHNYRHVIPTRPGDLVFFKGNETIHHVTPFTSGERHSFILYSHNYLFPNYK